MHGDQGGRESDSDQHAEAGACAQKSLRFGAFMQELIDTQADRIGVSREELVAFSVLYYLADLDSGRIARKLNRLPQAHV